MGTKQVPPVYIIVQPSSDNDLSSELFHGTLEQFQTSHLARSFKGDLVEKQLVIWAKNQRLKLQKRYKRGRKFTLVTLHDPEKPENIKFLRRKYGKRAGQKDNGVEYTDCDGNSFQLSLSFIRASKQTFDPNGIWLHKQEILMHLLNKLVEAVTGKAEED